MMLYRSACSAVSPVDSNTTFHTLIPRRLIWPTASTPLSRILTTPNITGKWLGSVRHTTSSYRGSTIYLSSRLKAVLLARFWGAGNSPATLLLSADFQQASLLATTTLAMV